MEDVPHANDGGEDIEREIAHLEAALIIYTRDQFPREWAATQHRGVQQQSAATRPTYV
jgi:hypothetical protein